MLKKSKIFIYCILFILVITGCSKEHTAPTQSIIDEKDNTDTSYEISNPILKLYNKNDEVIGEIECHGYISLIDGYLFHTSLADGSSFYKTNMSFNLYNIETKEKYLLGTINDVIVEVSYDRVLLNDHIYTIITTGDPNDRSTWMYNLIDFDLKEKSMDILLSEKDDYLYNLMDSIDNDLLIVRENSGTSIIQKYDIAKKTFTTLKEYEYDSDTQTGESIYHVFYNKSEGNIYTLRCKFNGSAAANIFVDKSDKNMKLISSTDISDTFEHYEDASMNESEKKQPVFDFFLEKNYMYYESRSTTRIIGELKDNSATSIIAEDPYDYSTALRIDKDRSNILFFKQYYADCPIYILNTDTGKIQETFFKVKDDDRYCINLIFQYGDKLLIEMGDIEIHAADEREVRLYLLDIDDILE